MAWGRGSDGQRVGEKEGERKIGKGREREKGKEIDQRKRLKNGYKKALGIG